MLAPVPPKPLTPPGCVTDGFGRVRPLIVPAGPLLSIEQANTLRLMGVALAMAQLVPECV